MVVRSDLWPCQFLLPIVSLGVMFFRAHIAMCACACHSMYPTMGTKALHLLGLCTLRVVGCFMAGVQLLHSRVELPDGGSRGGVQFMTAALLVCVSRSSHKEYSRMQAYRVA
ncbi:claudin domain-containing protein 1-like [Acipenser ruthenus]|uniref:claudin domain-containing protein 1-like n=1 Tax=Acipenser ruthenus TaxID=7906 RepID=UPI00274104E9|nr:claudin domain-containing protein 1-like [Acipenser ruthenus]